MLVEFEKDEVNGLKRPIFEVCGANRTFPLGKSTPPLKFGDAPVTAVNEKS
jgi:hypothetical protein